MRRALLVLSLFLPACTAIVGNGDPRIRCDIVTRDPCPNGSRCIEHFCTPLPDGSVCAEEETGCNDADDDCDGRTDEGSDNDMDGFEWCANDAMLRDCRDDNATIHPAGDGIPAPEDRPCDGADNDCNGLATECVGAGLGCDPSGNCRELDCSFAFSCPTGQRCDTSVMPAQCMDLVGDDCTDPSTPCDPPLVCDPLERTCITPRGLGEACAVDDQCESALCVSREALGLDAGDVNNATQVCTSLCCSDLDCPIGTVCWAPGTGARGCVPLAILALGPYGAPTGEACSQSWECKDECVLRSAPAYNDSTRRAYNCGSAVGTSTLECNTSADCRSGLCLVYCPLLCYTECSTPCGSSTGCADSEFCGWAQLGGGSAHVQTCIGGRVGDGSGGSSCSDESDCRDEACLSGASGSYCADTCCADFDCGFGFWCRPTRNHGRWEMLCVEG